MYFNAVLCQSRKSSESESNSSEPSQEPEKPSGETDGPLFLTPLLRSGLIKEARMKSEVSPFAGNIVSNSGFFTVNEEVDANLFFWFFQKTSSNWQQAPVLLWLEGGPGCSSMFSLFTENGPYKIVDDEIELREYAWTNDYNVLFIDNPINTGFSFAKNYFVTNETEIADHLYEALLQFFQLYPELGQNEFYITGESYAGKYIPAVAYKIYKNSTFSEFPINLQGLLIGNGFSDPVSMQNYAQHVHRLGLIDHRTRLQIESIQDDTRIFIRSSLWQNAFEGRVRVRNIIRNVTEFKYLWNYLRENDQDDNYVELLQEEEIKEAIHVGELSYVDRSKSVFEKLKSDMPKSVRCWVEELLEKYPILMYSGMLDIQVGHFLTTDFLDSLHWSGADLYGTSSRKKWYVDDQVAGYLKTAGNLKYALIRNAGHTVPTNKPKVMLDLVNKFISKEW